MSDCQGVKDRLAQDPALKFQNDYLMERATGLENATGPAVTVLMPFGSSGATGGAGYELLVVTVSTGATIVWDNQDDFLHTATSGKSPTPDWKFDTGIVGLHQ